jgi:hypothetical protein
VLFLGQHFPLGLSYHRGGGNSIAFIGDLWVSFESEGTRSIPSHLPFPL